MLVNLLVNCQYYENYNVGPEGFGDVPYWKPKGGHYFLMPIDSEDVFYAEPEVLKSAINNLLEKHNSIAEKFECIDYEIQWEEPTRIEGLQDELNTLLDEMAV